MTVTLEETPISIPLSAQRRAGFKQGDKVAIKVSRGVITIMTSPADHPLLRALAETQKEARKNGTADMSMKRIDEIVAEVRKRRKNSAPAKRSK